MLSVTIIQAQPGGSYELLLKSGKISPQSNINTTFTDNFNRQAARAAGKSFIIIQFEAIPGQEQIKLLRDAGIELLEYIPNSAYTATVTGSLDPNLLTSVKVRSIINPLPEYKMQPALAARSIPAWASRASTTIFTPWPKLSQLTTLMNSRPKMVR